MLIFRRFFIMYIGLFLLFIARKAACIPAAYLYMSKFPRFHQANQGNIYKSTEIHLPQMK
jgi:hypothetical protein